MSRPTAIVIGVGAQRGIGAALCRRFASEGYHVLVAGRTASKIESVAQAIRSQSGSAEALVTDATREADVVRLFDRGMSPGEGREAADLVVFNAGANRPVELRELEASEFEEFWRIGCFAGFLVGREAARRLVPLGRGTVVFTGASASLRGRPRFAHFAAAKAGLRMIAQSMARELGPQGVHVAHVVVDGVVKGERALSAPAAAAFLASRGEDGLLEIDAIAEAYWFLHKQPRSAWTHELDLRPYKEGF